MTIYTIRQNAQDLLNCITNAPDLNTHANLIDQLKDQFIENATVMQALAESNERWANETRTKQQAVEAYIERELENDEDAAQSSNLQELAEAFEIELTQEVNVTVRLRYEVTVTVPRGTKLSEVEGGLTWSGEPDFDIDLADCEVGEVTNKDWDADIEAEFC